MQNKFEISEFHPVDNKEIQHLVAMLRRINQFAMNRLQLNIEITFTIVCMVNINHGFRQIIQAHRQSLMPQSHLLQAIRLLCNKTHTPLRISSQDNSQFHRKFLCTSHSAMFRPHQTLTQVIFVMPQHPIPCHFNHRIVQQQIYMRHVIKPPHDAHIIAVSITICPVIIILLYKIAMHICVQLMHRTNRCGIVSRTIKRFIDVT